MKLLVEISQGLGNCIQATPLLHALWLMGHELDVYINSPLAKKVRTLLHGWHVVGELFTDHSEYRINDYDFGVSAYGRRRLVREFAPGMCLKIEKRHAKHQSESEANVEIARWLGYVGDTPKCHVRAAQGNEGCTARTVVVHAGCDPANMAKRWPHWREICSRLRELGRHVLVTGTEADRAGWEDEFDDRIGLPLPETAAALNHAGLYLGNDSGLGHLAAACGTPGLMLYGPTDPVKNSPNSRVLRPVVAGGRGPDGAPIENITLEQVWAEVETMLNNPPRDPDRKLPPRLNDGVDLRWQHYIESTRAQPEQRLEIIGEPVPSPRVSVVIPTHNRADNAMRAVKSALAQTESSLEILLVDDGSTDETRRMFEQPPPRVRYIRKPNGGAGSARNAGLRHARGEYIALLDSDDEWAPEKLALQLNAMGESYVASACRHVHINVDGTRQEKPETLPGLDSHLFRDLYDDLSLKTSTLVFKRHLLERVGLFHERFKISNDWDFFLRLARVVNNSGFVCLPNALVTVHRSPDSLSKIKRANALEEALTRIRMVNALLHSEDPAAIKRHIKRAGRKHLELARAYRKQGDKELAREHAAEAMRAGLRLKGLWKLIQAM